LSLGGAPEVLRFLDPDLGGVTFGDFGGSMGVGERAVRSLESIGMLSADVGGGAFL